MKSLLITLSIALFAFEAFAQEHTKFFYFNTDEYELARNQLGVLQKWISTLPDSATVEITGFTDTVGNSNYNNDLGYKRAESIRQVLAIYKPKIEVNYTTMGETLARSQDLSHDRKVEINYVFDSLNCSGSVLEPKVHLKGNPSYFTDKEKLKNGVFIKYNAKYTKINDVKTGINEEEMIENEFYAFDDKDKALITGGMVDIDFESETGDTIEINIPAESFDSEMRLYIGFTDKNGELRWKVNEEPLSFDSVAGTYAIRRNTPGPVNVDKPGQVIYSFNFAKPNIINAKLTNPSLTFAGLPNESDIVFAGPEKVRLRRSSLKVAHTNDKNRTKFYNVRVWHFKKKKEENNYYFTLRKWFKKKYDFA